MTSPTPIHTWARTAVRETLRRCVISLVAGAEREHRRYSATPATRQEAAEQQELAASLRKQARKKGLL
jgi:hypothetical protein